MYILIFFMSYLFIIFSLHSIRFLNPRTYVQRFVCYVMRISYAFLNLSLTEYCAYSVRNPGPVWNIMGWRSWYFNGLSLIKFKGQKVKLVCIILDKNAENRIAEIVRFYCFTFLSSSRVFRANQCVLRTVAKQSFFSITFSICFLYIRLKALK